MLFSCIQTMMFMIVENRHKLKLKNLAVLATSCIGVGTNQWKMLNMYMEKNLASFTPTSKMYLSSPSRLNPHNIPKFVNLWVAMCYKKLKIKNNNALIAVKRGLWGVSLSLPTDIGAKSLALRETGTKGMAAFGD